MKIRYNKIVPVTDKDSPFHKENGMELIRRIKWFRSQIARLVTFPRYNGIMATGDIAMIAMQPQRIMVDKGIASIFDNKNNKGN